MDCLTALKANPTFQNVPDEQLDWLVNKAECRDLPADTIMHRPGDPVDHLYIVLSGRIRIYIVQAGQHQEFRIWEAGSVSGVLPFSRMKESISVWQTLDPTCLLALHRDDFREMIQTQYELTETFVQQMTTRVRETTRQVQQNDKMMSLGRMSAGLAHELNNPVAAVVRSVDTLKDHLKATPRRFKDVMSIQVTGEVVDEVSAILFRKMEARATAKPLTLMERSNLEDDVMDWLDDHNVADAADLTEALTDFGFGPDELDSILEKVGEADLNTILNWLVNNLVTEKLVVEIEDASKRIASLVGSIKAYTHMDRGAGKEIVPLREGIESTLTLLKHKLKEKNIQVRIDMPEDLPQVEAYASQLNQVWTNLIDNAIDAMSDGGQLQIKSEVDREFMLTSFIDSGSGIPADAIDQIFDPFFTTKEIGKGTGLGLDIVNGIVRHHNGRIYVDSKPGRTEFKVCIPIRE